MKVISLIIGFIISILDKVLPVFGVPDSFFNLLDNAFLFLINLFRSASYFIPLDILVICLTVMLIADNFALFMRIGQFVLKLIRG